MLVLLSGGLDSVAAWRLLGVPPAVHFILGTIPVKREHKALEWAAHHFDSEITYRHLPMGEYETENGYLPYRNALLLLAAAQMDGEVVLAQVAEWAPDKNRRFYRRLEKSVNAPGKLAGFSGGLRVKTPFAHLSKGELLARYDKEFGPREVRLLIQNTWSCYRDESMHCGHCGACNQRRAAGARYGELTGRVISERYAGQPPLNGFPHADHLRWVRDNGLLGVRQIRAEAVQNRALARSDANSLRPRAEQTKNATGRSEQLPKGH